LETLHGALAGARGFLALTGVGEVAFEIDVLLFCFGGQREVCVARDACVSLDEIGAKSFDFVDGASGVVGLFYDDGAGQTGRTASTMPLAGRFPGMVAGARVRRGKRGIFFAGHDANSAHAIGGVEGKLVYIVNVDVHVPEAGDEETLRARRWNSIRNCQSPG